MRMMGTPTASLEREPVGDRGLAVFAIRGGPTETRVGERSGNHPIWMTRPFHVTHTVLPSRFSR